MTTIVSEETIELSSPPDRVWPGISDTERMNRRLGLGSVKLLPNPDQGSAARFIVETEQFGLKIRYEEFPFEWTKDREYKIRRRFLGGPLEGYSVSVKVEPKGQGSVVSIRIDMTPRMSLLKPLAWAIAKKSVAGMIEVAKEIDEALQKGATVVFAKPASGCDVVELRRALERLGKGGVDSKIVASLAEFVASAADADCIRMRPLELAAAWGESASRDEVVRVFLHAVPAGLLELRWSLVCPSCRTSTEDRLRLEDIGLEGHCRLCDITYGLDLDRAVEATFAPHAAIRKRTEQLFCVGGPARTPHVLTQSIVEKGGKATIHVPLREGRYRLFVRGGNTFPVVVSAGGAQTLTLAVGETPSADLQVAPLGSIELTNDGEPRHVKLEVTQYADTALTAHAISTIPDFRRLFSSELLKAETPLRVARVSLLFSDLVGSTALYSKVGDAAAFRLVDDHFDVLREAIEAEHGVIIKTMGDAIMASFSDGKACARAAIRALKEFELFRARHEHGSLVGLKLGMHSGPCYAVTANGVLDYFGQTVNVSARVQALAGSAELVLAEDVWEDIGQEALDRMRVVERFSATVKGVDEPLHLVRLQLTGSIRPPGV